MKPRKPLSLPGIDGPAVLREALRLVERRLDAPARRAFLARGLTLGGLAMLSGCSLSDNESAEKRWASSRAGTTACRPGCSTPTSSRPPIRNR